MNNKIKLIGASVAVAGLVLAGCSAKGTEQFNDAGVGAKDDSPAVIYSMPDGFNNVASKCDRNGHRIFVVFHGDSKYGSVAVIDDPACR